MPTHIPHMSLNGGLVGRNMHWVWDSRQQRSISNLICAGRTVCFAPQSLLLSPNDLGLSKPKTGQYASAQQAPEEQGY